MSKAKRNRIRVFIIALALLLMPLVGQTTPKARAMPSLGVHDYYSGPNFTFQVGSITLNCDFTSCCEWGYSTSFVILTPFECEE